MTKHQTSKPSAKERTGVDRLYKRVGVRKISYYYQHPDGSSETLATAVVGDRKGIADADRAAKRKALDIIEGKIIAGSVAQLIERFRDEIAPTHYLDQSKDGLAVRESGYKNLTKFRYVSRQLSHKAVLECVGLSFPQRVTRRDAGQVWTAD